jgi:mRNA interferase RelE/StbE
VKYNLKVYKQAARYYQKLSSDKQRKINGALDEIGKEPFEGMHIKKLKGELTGKYRYHAGDYRIIYSVDKRNRNIYIEAIGPRGDVYK